MTRHVGASRTSPSLETEHPSDLRFPFKHRIQPATRHPKMEASSGI